MLRPLISESVTQWAIHFPRPREISCSLCYPQWLYPFATHSSTPPPLFHIRKEGRPLIGSSKVFLASQLSSEQSFSKEWHASEQKAWLGSICSPGHWATDPSPISKKAGGCRGLTLKPQGRTQSKAVPCTAPAGKGSSSFCP